MADTSLISQEERLTLINAFPGAVQSDDKAFFDILKTKITGASINPHEKVLLENISLCTAELKKLPPQHQALIMEVLRAVCAGMEFDLSVFPSDNTISEEDLKRYCSYMGGAPGVYWSKLILLCGEAKEEKEIFISQGKNIGDAMQITNILRDVPEDIKNGRRYVNIQDKNKWLKWGIQNIESAPKFFSAIPKKNFAMRASVTWPVLWMLDTYALLAKKDILSSERIKISKWKIYLTFLETPLFLISNKYFEKKIKSKIAKITIA